MEGMDKKQTWEGQSKNPTEAFHLDPNKQGDAVVDLLERFGPEGAVEEVMARLDENPGDAELRREANLLAHRLEELSSRLRGKIQH